MAARAQARRERVVRLREANFGKTRDAWKTRHDRVSMHRFRTPLRAMPAVVRASIKPACPVIAEVGVWIDPVHRQSPPSPNLRLLQSASAA